VKPKADFFAGIHEVPPPSCSFFTKFTTSDHTKVSKTGTKVLKHIKNDPTISQVLKGGLTLAEASAQFTEDNIRILQEKKNKEIAKTKRCIPNIGPRLAKHFKKRISD